MDIRIGHGFDVHRFVRGRKLMLGGIEIPYDRGLAGHSDADAVLHALINAIFGALSDGDIGSHFPDTDPRYDGIASGELLKQTVRIMRRKRFKIVNADVTVIVQQPKLAAHYGRIRQSIARLCGVTEGRVNIKATTTEKLGWTGAGKGLAATAVVLLSR
jgi:2-C-methyl-D-erythritol 2,4-cyclodiphosphate synthase